ncbi:MAG: hypothetical protein NT173_11435 [Opitutales bacterium]|nr:hypothetical protein [Opitutales bacterium]
MNPRGPVLLFLALALGGEAAVPAAPGRFFAAVAMTKAQRNSPVPADSGLYRRDAQGAWQHFGPRILGVASVAVHPAWPDLLLIASADGVVRSADGGRTWRKTTGWEVADVRSLAFDPAQPAQVYAATAWELYSQTILADRAQSGRVLLGTEDGIYVSTDAARSWTRVPSPAATILRLAQSGADARRLLAGTQGRGAWLSPDGGRTWAATDAGTATANLYAVALSPRAAALMAVGGWGVGVRVSADGGRTWADRSAGLPVKQVFLLAFEPGETERLWASTFEEGAFYSDDLGRTWQAGGLDGAYGLDFVFAPPAR